MVSLVRWRLIGCRVAGTLGDAMAQPTPPSDGMAAARRVLRERFGHADFLPGQERALRAALAGRNMLVVMPTGSGKSLLYQLPALLDERLTLVISPLIALMKDQVDELRRKGIAASFVNSSLGLDKQRERLRACARGDVRLLYVAPERFRSKAFCDTLSRVEVGRMAVDEAHCISEWGHDFRPDYRRLRELREHIGNPRVSALTATATPRVQRDIIAALGLAPDDVEIIVQGFDRPNLALSVVRAGGEAAKDEFLRRFVQDEAGAGIVYVGTRRSADEVAERLREVEPTAISYHAGLEPDARAHAQEAFLSGRSRIIVATIAFGMGIDKRDVRFVVHYHYPASVEGYYQEIGRSGRDGLPARCVLLYSAADRGLREFFIDLAYPSAEIVEEVYETLWAISENPVMMTYGDIAGLCESSVKDGQVGSAVRLLDAAGLTRGLAGDPLAVVTLGRPGVEILDAVRGPVRRRVLEGLAVAADLETPGRYEVSLAHVAWAAGVTEEQVRRALAALDREGHLAYEPPFRGRGVEKLVDDPPPFDEVPIDWERHAFLRALEEEKLEAMEDYIRTAQCRRAHIVRYFGEPTDLRCGVCDRCGQQAPTDDEGVLADEPLVARAVLVCIGHLRFPLGAQKIAQVVTGSRAQGLRKWGLHRNPAYGFLTGSKQRVRTVIDQLLKEGYIEDKPGQYGPVLVLTRRGEEVADATELGALEAEPRAPRTPKPERVPQPHAVVTARTADDGAIRRAALECVASLDRPVGVYKVAEVITGSHAAWIERARADRVPSYGTISARRDHVRQIIHSMVEEGLLRAVRTRWGKLLELTEAGQGRLPIREAAPGPKDEAPDQREEPVTEPAQPALVPEPVEQLPTSGGSRPERGLGKALDAMVRNLLSCDREKAKRLVEQLGLFHPREIASRLEALYNEAEGTRERSRAVWAAGELCGEHGLGFLTACSGSETGNVRRLAASALGKAAADMAARGRLAAERLARAREALTVLLSDAAPQVRQYAAKALEQFPDEGAD